MQLHEVLVKTTRRKRRIGRGGKRGTTSGRGTKGQKARAGRKIRPQIRDLVQKIPKKRGSGFSPPSVPVIVVDLATVSEHFNEGEKVTPRVLEERGLIDRGKKTPRPRVKVLGRGTLAKRLIFENVYVSSAAAKKIIGHGGEVRYVG